MCRGHHRTSKASEGNGVRLAGAIHQHRGDEQQREAGLNHGIAELEIIE